ncbi:MAG: transposase [Bacteroidetes bacterium]|nr:transposase [Bacteroidota bacterium]
MNRRRKHSSLRARWHDYSAPGLYHIILTLKERQPYFGYIRDSEMHLNDFGHLVSGHVLQLEERYDGLRLDTFAVMPDHVHLLVEIQDITRESFASNHTKDQAAKGRRRRMLIPLMVGYLKMRTAKEINHLQGTSGCALWQERYYDRIVRIATDIDSVRRYIVHNALHHTRTP